MDTALKAIGIAVVLFVANEYFVQRPRREFWIMLVVAWSVLAVTEFFEVPFILILLVALVAGIFMGKWKDRA